MRCINYTRIFFIKPRRAENEGHIPDNRLILRRIPSKYRGLYKIQKFKGTKWNLLIISGCNLLHFLDIKAQLRYHETFASFLNSKWVIGTNALYQLKSYTFYKSLLNWKVVVIFMISVWRYGRKITISYHKITEKIKVPRGYSKIFPRDHHIKIRTIKQKPYERVRLSTENR